MAANLIGAKIEITDENEKLPHTRLRANMLAQAACHMCHHHNTSRSRQLGGSSSSNSNKPTAASSTSRRRTGVARCVVAVA